MQRPAFLQGDSLTRLLQGLAAGAAATAIIGFSWGGWTLASTAQKQAADAERAGIVRVLAPICADRFRRSDALVANQAALKEVDSWKRDEFIEKAGWTTFPGSEPDRRVAAACVNLLGQTN